MSQFVNEGVKAFTAVGAYALYTRVYISSAGSVTSAGADNVGAGTIESPSLNAGDPCTVRLWNAHGTRKVLANGAISAGSLVYAAASGKVGASGTVPLGIANETSTADGDVIEILPLRPGMTVTTRQRFTIAQVNAGATLLTAVPLLKWRMQDVLGIAIGGNMTTLTTVDVLGTQSSSSVKLAAFAQASMTQSTVLRPGVSGTTVLANGASFAQCDAGTAVTVSKTGSDGTVATHVDIVATFSLES